MRLPHSLRLLSPLRALLWRRVSGRWWTHERAESTDDLPDLADHLGRQTFKDGTGDVVRRSYTLGFEAPDATAADVMRWFRGHPQARSPAPYARFSGPIGEVGQEVTVALAGPWNGPVEVLAADDHHVVLGTLDGHMEAGWIRFETRDADDGSVTFTITSAAKAADAVFWLLHVGARIGQWVQADMWSSLLESAAHVFGDGSPQRVRIQTVTHPLADGQAHVDVDTEPAPER